MDELILAYGYKAPCFPDCKYTGPVPEFFVEFKAGYM